MAPFCSRSRSPSARNRKSNFPRSAAWANRTKEPNSMWLPAAGSLQTVVLLTPGKCAARWTCLVMAASSDSGVAVGGARQPEQAAQGGRLVGGAAQPASLQLGPQPSGDLAQVVRQRGGAHPEAGEPGLRPVGEQVGELGRCPGEDLRVADVLRTRPLVEPVAAGPGRRRG